MTTAANTILLQYTAPIWVALMAGWFLKEKTKVHDWITIVFAFGGTIVSLRMMKNGSPVEMAYIGNILTFLISVPFYIAICS